MKVAIVSDTNSGLLPEKAKSLVVHLIPMPFMINGDVYYEGVNLSQDAFYAMLDDKTTDISTSQPSVADVLDLWDRLLEEYDEIVYVPMSSGLSGSCDTAMTLSRDYDGRVQVVDNHRISVTMKRSVEDAVALAANGLSAAEIKARLEDTQHDSSIYIMVDTMKYLKKGGRVTAAAATIGTVLNIKPVLQIQGGKLDAFAKPRGQRAACTAMLEAMKADFESRFADMRDRMELYVVHTNTPDQAVEFAEEVAAAFPQATVQITTLPLSIACHIGPGALAIATAVSLEK